MRRRRNQQVQSVQSRNGNGASNGGNYNNGNGYKINGNGKHLVNGVNGNGDYDLYPKNGTNDLMTRAWLQANELFTKLTSKPGAMIVLLFALVLTVSIAVTKLPAKDFYDQMVNKMLATDALKAFGEFLELRKIESMTVVWFVGVWSAVRPQMKIYVVGVGAITVLALDWSVTEGAVLAICTYIFLEMRDQQVRNAAIILALCYMWYTYTKKRDDDVSPSTDENSGTTTTAAPRPDRRFVSGHHVHDT